MIYSQCCDRSLVYPNLLHGSNVSAAAVALTVRLRIEELVSVITGDGRQILVSTEKHVYPRYGARLQFFHYKYTLHKWSKISVNGASPSEVDKLSDTINENACRVISRGMIIPSISSSRGAPRGYIRKQGEWSRWEPYILVNAWVKSVCICNFEPCVN